MQASEEIAMDQVEFAMHQLRTEIQQALESPEPRIAEGAAQMIRAFARTLGMVDEEKAA